MATPISAKNAMVRVNGSTVAVKRWMVTAKTDALDITNSEGGGYDDSIAGIVAADITLEFDYDSASPQLSNPPNLAAGQIISNLILYVNGTSSYKWTFSYALVVESPLDAPVRETLKGSCTLKSKGSFTFGA